MAQFRAYRNNLVQAQGTILTASSALVTAPVAWLRNQIKSKRWRSALGWTFTAGFNDQLPFLCNGDVLAGIMPAGTYATGAEVAAAATAALNDPSVGVPDTYLVTYDTATFKFTLARATGSNSFGIPLASAIPNRSCLRDLGFDVDALDLFDLTGSLSYTAPDPVHQSRHWLKAGLPSAQGVKAAIAAGSRATPGLTAHRYKLQAHTIDDWTGIDGGGPSYEILLFGNEPHIVTFAEQTYKWWRLVIDDVSNTDGFSELGIWYAGDYDQPSLSYGLNWQKPREELSSISFADAGAHHQVRRPTRRAWALPWQVIPDADRILLEAIADACPRGTNLFVSLDALVPPLDASTYYGFFEQGLTVANVPTGVTVTHAGVTGMLFRESLD